MNRANQKQAGQVGARNDEDGSSDPKKKKEYRPRDFRSFSKRRKPDIKMPIKAGEISRQLSADGFHLGAGLFDADIRAQAGINAVGWDLAIPEQFRRTRKGHP